MPALSVAADQEHQLELGHEREQAGVPGAGALPPRRQVASGRVVAGKAEPHGHDGDPALVVELLWSYPEPGPQPVAGGVREGLAGGMDAHAGRLAADAQACRGARAKDRPRVMGQRRSVRRIDTDAARPHLAHQPGKLGRSPAHTSSTRPSSASTTRGSFTSPRRASIVSAMCVSMTRLAPTRSRLASMVFQLV